jgi:hypothetical protein
VRAERWEWVVEWVEGGAMRIAWEGELAVFLRQLHLKPLAKAWGEHVIGAA